MIRTKKAGARGRSRGPEPECLVHLLHISLYYLKLLAITLNGIHGGALLRIWVLCSPSQAENKCHLHRTRSGALPSMAGVWSHPGPQTLMFLRPTWRPAAPGSSALMGLAAGPS